MKIAVIGMGSVGGALGRRLAELGHSVTFGARDPQDKNARDLVSAVKGQAAVASVADAARASEIVVLATPWSAVSDAITSVGDLSEKIIIDVTNPIKPDLSGLALARDTSAAQQVARLAPGARVYKAMNQTGYENMADPSFPDGTPVMFVAGDDPAGKETVLSLVRELGFDAVDAGGLASAGLLEDLAMLWIHLAVHQHWGTGFAFSLVRKGR